MTVLIVNDLGEPLADVTVTGSFRFNGRVRTNNCDTAADGMCNIQLTGLKNIINEVEFTVDDVQGSLPYAPAKNTDSDGDSDGTTYVLKRP